MSTIDLNLLESLSSGDNLEKVQEIFNSLMVYLKEKLGIEPHATNIKIVIKDEESLNANNPFKLGISSTNILNEIHISRKAIKFLPQILLRECYKLFIIPKNRKSIPVQFIVCMIIESELETLNNITEWKKIIRSYEKYRFFLTENRDMVIKFFKLEEPDTKESVIPAFFHLINSLEFDSINNTIFDIMVIEFLNRIKLYLQDEGILETIKVLKEIFFTVKNYRAFLDYQDFFKKFKESGIITTDLSLRKFSSNVRWLNKHSFCAPNYHLDWFTINMAIYIIHIRFHPCCRWKNVKVFMRTLPFFLWPQLSAIGFTREFFGYIVIPTSYIKDLKQSFEFFENTGFFHEIKLYEPDTGRYFLNLNYYRNLTEMGKFLHSQRKGYREDFELTFKTRYQKKVVLKKLSLLDFILLDRVRNISFTGFGFERRESTLKDIKSDLLKEISYQKNIIVQLRNIFDRFSESPELKKKFLNLLQLNKKYSFFTFKEYIEQIVDSIELSIEIIGRNSLVNDPASFKEYVKKYGISMSLHKNLNLNIQRVRDLLTNELIPLYFRNNNLFQEEYKAFLIYNEFLSVCMGLKIYDLNSVKIILTKEKLDLIYRAKEEKLDLIYKESQLRDITSVEIENRLEDFSSSIPPIISPKMLDSLIAVLHSTISFNFLAKKTKRVLNVLEELAHTIPHYTYYELKNILDDQVLIFCRFGIQEMDINEKYEFYSIIHNKLGDDLCIFTRYIHQGYYSPFSRRSYYDFIDGTFFYTSHLYSEFKKQIRDRFGKNLDRLTIQAPKDSSNFWLSKTNLISFIDELNQARITEPQNFDLNQLNQLIDFNKRLNYFLLNPKDYQVLKEKPFFSFVKSISLKLILQEFGLQKYYLYFQATDFNAIIPELLLINTFTSVRFNSPKFDVHSFLIKYIFPYNTPNKAYLNWQLFSKKNINEYCLFSIKKTHEIVDFSKNIVPDGWRINYNLFIQYIQKILFDPSYNPYNPNTRTLNFEKTHIDSYISPANQKFKDLLKIFKRKSNIKSFWGTKKGSKLELVVKSLLKSKLIHTSLKFKNLKLRECLYFIIPNLNEKQVKILLKIFQFFNVATISEIAGEFFLNSLEELNTFNNGLYIKLKLPEMEISPYVDVIFDVLDYLNIEHFIFFSELFKTEKWPSEVFKGIDLNNNYNPLLNLQWNDFDNIYMNHKLFGENFTPQYPKLN